MSYFLFRLNPPRPTFMLDMSDDERAIMQKHVLYWGGLCQSGTAIAFGPVADPTGGWGVGLIETADESSARELAANDPAILSERGFSTDILAMPRLVLREGVR